MCVCPNDQYISVKVLCRFSALAGSQTHLEQYWRSKTGEGFMPHCTRVFIPDLMTSAVVTSGKAAQAPGTAMQVPVKAVQVPGKAVQAPGKAMQVLGMAAQAPRKTARVQVKAVQVPRRAVRVPGKVVRVPEMAMQAPRKTVQVIEKAVPPSIHPRGGTRGGTGLNCERPRRG